MTGKQDVQRDYVGHVTQITHVIDVIDSNRSEEESEDTASTSRQPQSQSQSALAKSHVSDDSQVSDIESRGCCGCSCGCGAATAAESTASGETPQKPKFDTFRWFPSFRMMTATMLCLCFASVHMMNCNMGMAMVCMIDESLTLPSNFTQQVNDATSRHKRSENAWSVLQSNLSSLIGGGIPAPRMRWSAEDQGWIFGAFNAGLLCMLVTGFLADKINSKYMIIISVILASAANFMIPLTAELDVRYVMAARFLVGLSEALLQPAINSLVTRWFPGSERSYALGLATGGRQMGTLFIVPSAGALCSQTAFFGGWPSIFYISAITGVIFVVIYIFIGADKPSKQNCISNGELVFITTANHVEHMGTKRINREVPWKAILTSAPVWSALISVVCHEFPLMTMIMFLPSYLHDVHHYEASKNGILSAIPTACLWASKIGSSYLNTWMQENTSWNTSTISKVLNGVGSVGLALFMVGTTYLDSTRAGLAVVFLCFSMLFTGMHTPGCQAALVAVAPAFSGAITGLTFFFVAISGMINPAMTKWIVTTGAQEEWNIVFYISTVIALIPVVVFSVCGSAELQDWAAAAPPPRLPACPTLTTIVDAASFTSSAGGNYKCPGTTVKLEMVAPAQSTESDEQMFDGAKSAVRRAPLP